MRILCLNLQQTQEASCAEIFLEFSPRVQFRFPGYIFLDIESTSMMFGGELQILKKAVDLARRIAPAATGAIADSAPVAQMLVHYKPFEITKPGEDFKMIAKIPVQAITELEGLQPWPQQRKVQQIGEFFHNLGMDWIEDLYHFQEASFRERWGDLGIKLWKRLRNQDFQIISPLIPQEPLLGYGHFDDPVSLQNVLMQKIDPQLNYLFLRLKGMGRFAQRMQVTLFCEYSEKKYNFSIEPVSPSRDQDLFRDLLVKKLESVDLENPIREFEVFIYDMPEKIEQMDFFEPRDTKEDRWRRLISFAKQSEIEMGFLQVNSSHFPEGTYHFKSDWPEKFQAKDLVEWSDNNKAIQIKTAHAKSLYNSPRPTLLLKDPLKLTQTMLDKIKVLTKFPTERIHSNWWKKWQERDYYFGLSNEGQLVWVFRDQESQSYFLHGYFD